MAVHNAIARGGNNAAHNRARQIEYAIRQIGERGNAKHRALHHAASVPRNKHRRHGGRILSGAAQHSLVDAQAAIDVAKHTAGEQNAYVLVGSGSV